DERAVSPVIATILMVAITVVLAAVLYVMVSGLIVGPGASKPLVTFSAVTKQNAVTWTFSIASAQPAVAATNYKVNFGIGTSVGTAVNMGTSNVNTTVTVTGASPSSVGVKWTDVGGGGQVKGGDIFTIAFPSAPASGTSLTFYLLYSDGSSIQQQVWQA
ncbi:MAG TPA: archaellin/type IV pilin N-terminal domain-containing protein, partial [Thermoplasmata archaeon]|nr:archaellin/type IV pilin N-terminal domain-containing protein [Thermoplasmata archaeon]